MCTSFSGPLKTSFIQSSNLGTSAKNLTSKKSIKNLLKLVLRGFGLFGIGFYRVVLAPTMGGVCRFEPSCSCYAEEAFSKLPSTTAFKLTFFRLLACRPGGRFGYDPVPAPAQNFGDAS